MWAEVVGILEVILCKVMSRAVEQKEIPTHQSGLIQDVFRV